MTNIVSLTGKPVPQAAEPNADLIRGLEQLLAMAKEGDLQSFWGSGFTATGARVTAKGGYHNNVIEFAGALAWLQEEYLSQFRP